MFSKILAITAFVAVAQAGVFELPQVSHASSYSSVSHHDIGHEHGAPIAHIAAPVATYHAAPVATYHAAPVLKAVHHEEYADAHPHYAFQYGVHDGHTGDVKDQKEERDGDVVKGEYTIVQPDGVKRIVHYTADHHNGFNAQVEYTGHASHPQQVHKVVAAKVIAAPVYHH